MSYPPYPDKIESVEELEELLSRPPDYLVETLKKIPGDILILGVAGKMGPTLARMAKRAVGNRRVLGVARFSKSEEQKKLEAQGIETIKTDLLDQKQLDKLPDAPNIIYMPAMKFGSSGQEALTWAMNTYLPGMCAQRYAKSKIVAFSTGNIYGLSPVVQGGPTETGPLNPLGDYAMSCLGRERIFEHFSRVNGTPVSLIRLNYATEMRYGVMVDMAANIWAGNEIPLSMGAFNAIWQGDANAMSLAALAHASSPPFVLNVSGPELFSVRAVCEHFGRIMKKTPRLVGEESTDSLFSNSQLAHRLFGYPEVPAQQMMQWIAAWVMSGGASLGKPTHFETRNGKF